MLGTGPGVPGGEAAIPGGDGTSAGGRSESDEGVIEKLVTTLIGKAICKKSESTMDKMYCCPAAWAGNQGVGRLVSQNLTIPSGVGSTKHPDIVGQEMHTKQDVFSL